MVRSASSCNASSPSLLVFETRFMFVVCRYVSLSHPNHTRPVVLRHTKPERKRPHDLHDEHHTWTRGHRFTTTRQTSTSKPKLVYANVGMGGGSTTASSHITRRRGLLEGYFVKNPRGRNAAHNPVVPGLIKPSQRASLPTTPAATLRVLSQNTAFRHHVIHLNKLDVLPTPPYGSESGRVLRQPCSN